MSGFYLKDQSATLEYSVDWNGEIAGDTVATPGDSVWFIDPPFDPLMNPSGLRVYPGSSNFTAGVSACAFFSGEIGRTYEATNRVALASGRTLARTLSIRVGKASVI